MEVLLPEWEIEPEFFAKGLPLSGVHAEGKLGGEIRRHNDLYQEEYRRNEEEQSDEAAKASP